LKKIILIVVAILVVGSIVAGVVFKKEKPDAEVEKGKVSRKDLTSLVNCSGTMQPKRKVDVSANTMGTILNLAVSEGGHVQEGDLLMEIDPAEFRSIVLSLEATVLSAQADLQLAQASLDKAQQEAKRSEDLSLEGLVS